MLTRASQIVAFKKGAERPQSVHSCRQIRLVAYYFDQIVDIRCQTIAASAEVQPVLNWWILSACDSLGSQMRCQSYLKDLQDKSQFILEYTVCEIKIHKQYCLT